MSKKSKLVFALAIAAVLILVGSTVVRCTLVHQSNGPATSTTEQSSGQDSSNQNDAQTQATDTSVADATAEAVSILQKNAWSADDGKASIAFKDGRFVETDGTTSALTTFDVTSVSAQPNQTTVMVRIDNADATTSDSMLLIRKSETGALRVVSDSFKLAKSYNQGKANSNPVKVEINDEFCELLGGTTDALGKAITDYAHENAPTATKATWDKSLVVDYAENRVSANFTLDDAAATVLTVEYARSSATFSVMG